jgi:hypothetical protein
MRTTLLTLLPSLFLLGLIASPSFAEDKSFYSPIIQVDKESHRILISTFGSVFWIDVPDAGKPHIEKLPLSGLADFVVEMRGDKLHLLRWENLPVTLRRERERVSAIFSASPFSRFTFHGYRHYFFLT